jgi:hypothetical protein
MCILIHGAADTLRRVLLETPGLMASILHSNPDGLGLMYAGNGGEPAHHKTLTASSPDAVALATAWLRDTLPADDRPVAFHARYTTHGDKDLENCHPYPVDGGYLMHNGVLDIETRSNSRRSDTWHYCRSFFDEGAAHAILTSERGRKLVGEHIGDDNRFAFLTRDGQIVIVNRNSGVEYEGLWFSNTYAWDVGLLDPAWGLRSYRTTSGDPRQAGYRDYFWRDAWDDQEEPDELEDSLDVLRDCNGSLAYLVNMDANDLADILVEFGVDQVLGELLDELGAPTMKNWPGITDDETRSIHWLCHGLSRHRVPSDAYRLERTGHHEAIAEAVIHGLDWFADTCTQPLFRAAEAVR